MPFSPGNPNRNRNYVIAMVGGVALFAIIMAVYTMLALAGRDTDGFMRFLTLLVVTLVPSALAAFRSNTAANHAEKAVVKVEEVKAAVEDGLNGNLDDRVREVVRQENMAQTKREDHQ